MMKMVQKRSWVRGEIWIDAYLVGFRLIWFSFRRRAGENDGQFNHWFFGRNAGRLAWGWAGKILSVGKAYEMIWYDMSWVEPWNRGTVVRSQMKNSQGPKVNSQNTGVRRIGRDEEWVIINPVKTKQITFFPFSLSFFLKQENRSK
jgi:hypothetical protein